MSLKKIPHKGRNFSVLEIPSSNIFKLEITNNKGANAERAFKKLYGSNVYGGSHLIEHLGFKATKHYSSEELMVLLKQYGTYNANTGYERINYFYLTSMDNWKLGVDLITDATFNDFSNISDEEYEKEKDVVYNEVKRYNDDAQTMFYFDITKTVFGYEDEDTVLGSTESVEALKFEDLKKLKGLFLNEKDHVYSLTYDPKFNLEEILDYISDRIDSYNLQKEIDSEFEEVYTTMINKDISFDTINIKADTEQSMEYYMFNELESPYLMDFMNSYVSSLAPNISLNDYIREKNGLTYGINFYTTNNNGIFNLAFACDVTAGNEDLLLSLFKQSVKECAETFDEEKYNNLVAKKKLNTSINMLDKKEMMGYSKHMFVRDRHWEEIAEFFEEDASMGSLKIIDNMTFERCNSYLQKLNNAAQNNEFKIIKGHKDA